MREKEQRGINWRLQRVTSITRRITIEEFWARWKKNGGGGEEVKEWNHGNEETKEGDDQDGGLLKEEFMMN